MAKHGFQRLRDVTFKSMRDATAPGYESCPRVTRTRLACLMVILLAAGLLLLYQCVGKQFCCSTSLSTTMTLHSGNQYISGSDDHTGNNSDSLRHAAARPQERRNFPQVIIIGVRKGGTRALLEFLNLHPRIVAEKAEMHFFDDDMTYRRGLHWYKQQMPLTYPGQLTIEKTPAYFSEEPVPGRIYRMNKTCKFLIVVRDPTERAISDYTQIYFNKVVKGKPFQSFEELAVDIYGSVNKSYKAIRRSMYYKHMERWLRYFPLEQFHFVDSAKFVKDPASELQQVEDFLGVDRQLTNEKFYYNSTRGFYCMKLLRKEKCLAKSKGRTHPYVDPKVIKILRKFFKPLIQKFYSITHRDFGWPLE